MTYKAIVKAIAEATHKRELDWIAGEIDASFENEKITWNDHQTLRNIAEKIRWGLE